MRRHFCSHLLVLALWAALFGAPQTSRAATTAVPDNVSTDDATAVLIDVTANDYDDSGTPLSVSLGSNGCPGNAEVLFDGTVLFTPTSPVSSVQTCTIGYTVNGQPSTVTVTLVPNDGGGGGNPGACGGNWGGGVIQPDGGGFRYQGQPLFLAGYYPGMHALTRAVHLSEAPTNSNYYLQLIDALAARNINLFRAFLTNYSATANSGRNFLPHPQHPTSCCTASPPAHVNWPSSNKFDLDQWNDDFFDHWNTVIAYAKSKGIIMELAFFENRLTWGWDNHGPVENGFQDFAAGRKYSLLAGQNNVNGVAINDEVSPVQWYTDSAALARQKAFVREAVKRLGGHDNILWELSNEPPIASVMSQQVLADWNAEICAAMRQSEIDHGHPRHAVVGVDMPEHRDVDGHGTPGNDENFTGVHANLVADFGDGSGPPLIADNDCCFNAGTSEAQRKKSWTSVISGAHPLLFNYKADEFYFSIVNSPSTLTTIERVGYPRKLVLERGLDFAAMVPRDDLVSNSGGDVWMRAKAGEQYLVYYLTSGSATFSSLPNDYQAEWFDPRSGRYLTAQPSGVNGQSATFQTPACGDFSPPSPDCNGGSDWVLYIEEQQPVPTSQRAYGGTPHAVGMGAQPIEIEHYDEMIDAQGNVVLGVGQNETYFDTTAGNANGGFRDEEDVDVIVAGRTHLNTTANGEWLEYTVDVQQAGPYALHLIYATRPGAGNGSMTLQSYVGANLEASLSIPLDNTNDSDPDLDWRYFTHCQTLQLGAGSRVIRLQMTAATYNIDKFQLVPAATTQSPYGGTARSLPGVIEAEHFDLGATVGYCDSTPENLGVNFRQEDWVDIAIGNGNHVLAWNANGEWLEYSVNVATPGTHEVEITYATLNNGQQGRALLQVLNGTTVEDSITFDLPSNGAPGPYEDIIVGNLNLTTGSKQLRFEFIEGHFAFAKMRIGDDTPPEPPVAADDTHWVPRGSTYVIPAADLLANDEPLNEVEIDLSQPIVSQPQAGTVTWDAASASFVFQSDPSSTSTQYFEYRMRLQSHPSITDVGRVTLYSISEAPVAENDAFIMPPNATLAIYNTHLLANDTGVWIAIDEVLNAPPGLVQGTNSWNYTPPFNQGTATFQYRVIDFHGTQSNIATVTITVSPSAGRPVANDDSVMMPQKNTDGTVAKRSILWSEVLSNDVSVLNGDMRIINQTLPPVGLLETGHIGGWNYYPPHANWQGTTSFTYLLEESGITATQWAEVSIQVVAAPSGGADSFQTGNSTPLTLSLSNDLMRNDNGFGADIDIVDGAWGQPSQGTLDTSVEGQVTYTPPVGWSGTASFTYVLANELDGGHHLWLTRSTPVTVQVVVDPADATAADDEVLVRPGATRVDIPLAELMRNDAPADELVFVGHDNPGLGSLTLVGDELQYTPSTDFERYGEDRFTYTVRRFGGNPNVQPTATVILRSQTPFVTNFGADFEGPDLSDWHNVVTHTGHSAQVSVDAATSGVQGLQISLGGGGGSAFVEHQGSRDISHLSVAFDFDPSGLTMADLNSHPLATSAFGSLALQKYNGRYRVSSWINLDSGGADTTGWLDLDGDVQRLRVEWSAASTPGQNDGYTRLWVDGILRGDKQGLDNHTWRSGGIRLGAIWGIDPGTSGTMAFDAFEVEIGPDHQPFFAVDDFENGDFSAWTGSVQVAGSLALAAETDNHRLAVTPAGQSSFAYLYDNATQRGTHFGARFELDRGSLVIPDGHNFFLYGSTRINHSWSANLRLRNNGGDIEIALLELNDAGYWTHSGWFALPNKRSTIEVEWWAASAPGANNGGLRLWIDDALQSEILNIDNDTRWFNRLSLGAAAAIDAGTTGTFYIDDYSAWQGTRSREHFAVDDFSGDLGPDWEKPVEVGGSVAVAPVAAFGGSDAASFTVQDGATAVYLWDDAPEQELAYKARMRLHLGDLQMANNTSFILLGASRIGYWVGSIRLGMINGQFQMRLVTTVDGASAWTGWIPIPNPTAAKEVTMEWWAASAPGADDGGIRMLLDDVLFAELLGLDNDTHAIDRSHIGAVGGVDAGTQGTFHIDDFESWR